jgi:hypothetical protein
VGSDQLFKTILEGMLQDFLELFFPEAAARLDFETLRLLGKEVFANVPEGEVREADVVAQIETLDKKPELVLIHVEVQAEHRRDFARRMFQYYSILRLHYRLPVFPIVVHLRGGMSSRLAEYREELFGQELLFFRYHSVALARLAAEEYVGTSPLGAALAALMERRTSRDRAQLRLSMLQRVLESEFDEAMKYLLVNVVETYFELSGEDAERYRRLVSRKENRAVQEVELTWADKLMEKGREAGVLQGKRTTLLRLLASKFGALPAEMAARVEALSEAELDSALDRLLIAATLEELRLEE